MFPWILIAFLLTAVFLLAIKLRRVSLLREADRRVGESTQATLEQRTKQSHQDQAQLHSVLANMVEGVLGVDSDGKIIAVNPALARIFDFSAQAAQGKHYAEVLRHSQVIDLIDGVLKACEQSGVCAGRMHEIRIFSPEEKIFDAHVEPIAGAGRCAGAILVLHDITVIRRMEQGRRDFVSNVSHELKTPLASILGFSETLLSGALEDKKNRREFVESIEAQALRMKQLVEDLLDLGAIESGQRKPNKTKILLGALAHEVMSSMKPLAAKKNLSVFIEIADDGPPVFADREQIKQVLLNLLSNAFKYTPNNGVINVSADSHQSFVRVVVKDNGPGLSAADAERVFERFYRVDKARSREQGGTGLGLAIVKHIVEAHGGSVGVESAEGQGAAFSFTLPL